MTTQEFAGLEEQIEQKCKAQGIRLTAKRQQVLLGLIQSAKAVSAYELAKLCSERFGSALPAMSVYRILSFLESEGLAHKLKVANKYVACAHFTCDHSHGVPQFIICIKCDRVTEAQLSDTVLDSVEDLVSESGYRLLSPQLELSCICARCDDLGGSSKES